MIELGGNITLSGFQDRDYAELIVIKKIVGRYARQISDQHQSEALGVTLKPGERGHTIEATVTIKGLVRKAEATEQNIFVALDSALKKLASELK